MNYLTPGLYKILHQQIFGIGSEEYPPGYPQTPKEMQEWIDAFQNTDYDVFCKAFEESYLNRGEPWPTISKIFTIVKSLVGNDEPDPVGDVTRLPSAHEARPWDGKGKRADWYLAARRQLFRAVDPATGEVLLLRHPYARKFRKIVDHEFDRDPIGCRRTRVPDHYVCVLDSPRPTGQFVTTTKKATYR